MAALGRTHAFIAGWAPTLGYSCVVALNASAVTLVFRVTLPELVTRGALDDVAGWTIYLPEVAICSLFIILFAWLNTKDAALSGQFQFFAVVLMILVVVIVALRRGPTWCLIPSRSWRGSLVFRRRKH